jgi:hypothetical protein
MEGWDCGVPVKLDRQEFYNLSLPLQIMFLPSWWSRRERKEFFNIRYKQISLQTTRENIMKGDGERRLRHKNS